MDRGAWWATIYGRLQTKVSDRTDVINTFTFAS